jgi:putative ABC transport system permease protein
MLQALWMISLREWRVHRLRVMLTTMGITLGVAVFFAVRTANASLLNSLQETVEKMAGKATLEVTAGEAGFPERVLDTVRSTPGVQVAEPVIEVMAQTSFADEGSILVLGVDTTGDESMRDYEFDRSQTEVADPLVYLAQPNSLMVSRAFAERHSLKIGDTFDLLTSQGRQNFTVQGLFKPVGIGEIFGGNIAVMDVYSAQVVFNRGRNFDRVDLMNSPDVPVGTVQQRLRAQLPSGLQVMRPEARGQALENSVTAMRIGMLITSFVAMLVGVYIIFNSFTIAVNQRWKQIGILRAAGVERRNIRRMFLIEACGMGVVGSALGIVGGYYLAALAEKLMGSIAASVYGLVSSPGRSPLRADLCVASFALGVAASLAGAWFPARAASQLDPALSLHNVEARARESVLGWGRAGTGMILILAGLLLVLRSSARYGASIQFFYAAVILIGLTLVLPKIVRWSAQVLRPAMNYLGGSEGALAVDSMIQAPRRTSATVGALMVGLMFVFSTAAYIQSFRRIIDRWTRQMINSDLVVSASALLRSPSDHFTEDLGGRIAAIPGVRRSESVRFTAVPYKDDTAAVIANDMEGFLSRAPDAIEGGNARTLQRELPSGEGFVVSRNFANRWGLGVGDSVQLETPVGSLDRPILGIVDDYRSEKGTIFMDRTLYKKYWNDSAVDFIDVDLQPGADPTLVKRQIEQITAGSMHAFVYTNAEFRSWISGLVDQFFTLNYMQLVVAILIAVLGIVNTLIISVSDRRREIGIIRAIGGLRSQIRKLVLLEALAISLVGVFIGALAGALNTLFMSHTISIILAGYSIPFSTPWRLILVSVPVVAAASLLAGWLPARRAARTEVIEAIGYE